MLASQRALRFISNYKIGNYITCSLSPFTVSIILYLHPCHYNAVKKFFKLRNNNI